ncbi:MAG: WecB/TagA/CpsF family glycosyltransferase [Chloroflexi bacterium]|nr:WecB/TagA/CpsF family glycosyltransferase [Chloroflexota bacterium]MCY4247153.1 WecB/TagA/CpsF family glycosyltransferase [Chloroflexota bacterium]
MRSERILLVQLADIGDLVLTTPALAALREARPKATIDLLAATQALPIVPAELVNEILSFDRAGKSASRAMFARDNLPLLLRIIQKRYDSLVFCHHFTLRAGLWKFRLIARASGAKRIIGLQNGKAGFLTASLPDEGFGARHQAQYWLDLVGLLGACSQPRPAQVRRQACPLLGDSLTSPSVVMHAGSGGYSPARRWGAERFAELARLLQEKCGASIVVVGQEADREQALTESLAAPHVNLTGKTTLPQLADVIANADLFVGADSGVMHIAAAVGTPVLSIFGPSNASAWQPWTVDGLSAVLRSGVACSPCSYVGQSIGAREGCAARTCMKLLRPVQALQAAREMLAGREPTETSAPPAERGFNNRRLNLLSVPVDAVSYADLLTIMASWIKTGGGARQICTVNPEFIMIAQGDPIFLSVLQRAALCVADGVGLLWACRRRGFALPGRITGSDGLPRIAQAAAQYGWRIFLLGAAPGIAERAGRALETTYPGLQIAGAYAGSPAAAEEDEIVARVNASRADILFVAYGAPRQDKWIARNLPRLQVSLAMGVGGSLDFIAGLVPRAPRWMRDRGLEWLYRLLRQPWRLRRMLRLPRFVFAVWRAADVHSATDKARKASKDVDLSG